MDWEFILSVCTVFISCVALFQTNRQIKLSNKQHLFDRRLKCYMIIAGMISLYKEHRTLLERKREDEPQFAIDLEFVWLTNNSYLEALAEAIELPLKQPHHKNFLRKIEELRTLATEIKLIFSGKEANLCSNFVSRYERTLLKIYQYQIILNHIRRANEKRPMTPEERSRLFPDEPEERAELYQALEQLKSAYQAILDRKADEKLVKQLALNWKGFCL